MEKALVMVQGTITLESGRGAGAAFILESGLRQVERLAEEVVLTVR